MKLTNYLHEFPNKAQSKAFAESLQVLILAMYPIAPHHAAEYFDLVRRKVTGRSEVFDIRSQEWPELARTSIQAEAKIAVQINGRMKKIVSVRSSENSTEDDFKEMMLNQPDVAALLTTVIPSRVVSKKDKFINICTE